MNSTVTGLVVLVLLIGAAQKLVSAANCDCSLYTPGKRPAVYVTSFETCKIKGQPEAYNVQPCDCQTRTNECLRVCANEISLRRISTTTSQWQKMSCAAEHTTVWPPGLNMLAGVMVKGDAFCPQTRLAQEMPFMPLCCRGSYGNFMFDNRCSWYDNRIVFNQIYNRIFAKNGARV